MFEQQTILRQQELRSLDRLGEQISGFTHVIVGPLLKIYNRYSIALEQKDILTNINAIIQKFCVAEKDYMKDTVAVDWFVELSVLVFHLACKHKKYLSKMSTLFSKALNFRKIRSLLNKRTKDIVLLKAFGELCFLQIYIQNKQYLNLLSQVRKAIQELRSLDQPLLQIPLGQLASVQCLAEEILYQRVSEKTIYRAVQVRRQVIQKYKQFFDRTIFTFYITETLSLVVKIFQTRTNILYSHIDKSEYIRTVYNELCTRDVYGDSVMRLKAKYMDHITTQVHKASTDFLQSIIDQQEQVKKKTQKNRKLNRSCNGILHQLPVATSFQRSHKSLHRPVTDQLSIIMYLIKSKQCKKTARSKQFCYSLIKDENKPVTRELQPQALEAQIKNIKLKQNYVSKPLVSMTSIKSRKNNSLLAKRLKRISMVLQQKTCLDSSLSFPLRFIKHLGKETCTVQIVFVLEKDSRSGSIELRITEPHDFSQITLFKCSQISTLNSVHLIQKYKQYLQKSVYYYQFYDGVRDEIESTDIIDMMMSQLVLELSHKLQKKVLGEYMLLKEYIGKHFYWKHLRQTSRISGRTHRLVTIPEVQDSLKFSLYLQNIVRSDNVFVSERGMKKSKTNKSMIPVLQYLSKSTEIICKVLKKTNHSQYYLDVLMNPKQNINDIQLVQGMIEINNVQFVLSRYSLSKLKAEANSSQPFHTDRENKKQVIASLLLLNYIPKSLSTRLIDQITNLDQRNNLVFQNKQHRYSSNHVRQISEAQREANIVMIDEDPHCDEERTKPKFSTQIAVILDNRKRDTIYNDLLRLVTIIVDSSLKQPTKANSRLVYQGIREYKPFGYFQVTIREQLSTRTRDIKIRINKIQSFKQTLFSISEACLTRLFKRLDPEDILDSLVFSDQFRFRRLLLQHDGTFLQSRRHSSNMQALIYRKKVYSGTVRINGGYFIVTIYSNFTIGNWTVQVYRQSDSSLKLGFMNLCQLGAICLKIDWENTRFTIADVYENDIDDFKREAFWLVLIQRSVVHFQKGYMQLGSVVVYLQRFVCRLDLGRKWVDVCLNEGPSLQDSHFVVYAYQHDNSIVYSTIEYASAKRLYVLGNYIQHGFQNDVLYTLGHYLASNLESYQYTEPLVRLERKDYISNNIQVMSTLAGKVNSQSQLMQIETLTLADGMLLVRAQLNNRRLVVVQTRDLLNRDFQGEQYKESLTKIFQLR